MQKDMMVFLKNGKFLNVKKMCGNPQVPKKAV